MTMKSALTLLFSILFAMLSAGCASLQHAGMAEYSVKPVIVEGKAICCEVSVKNGKEYASLKAHVQKTGDDYSVDLDEQTVSAFPGQTAAAGIAGKAIDAAATLGTSAIGGTVIPDVKAVTP